MYKDDELEISIKNLKHFNFNYNSVLISEGVIQGLEVAKADALWFASREGNNDRTLTREEYEEVMKYIDTAMRRGYVERETEGCGIGFYSSHDQTALLKFLNLPDNHKFHTYRYRNKIPVIWIVHFIDHLISEAYSAIETRLKRMVVSFDNRLESTEDRVAELEDEVSSLKRRVKELEDAS